MQSCLNGKAFITSIGHMMHFRVDLPMKYFEKD